MLIPVFQCTCKLGVLYVGLTSVYDDGTLLHTSFVRHLFLSSSSSSSSSSSRPIVISQHKVVNSEAQQRLQIIQDVIEPSCLSDNYKSQISKSVR